ncbi:Fc.00g010970.m01.CDS01 [Cosmosporella sp. VM-42]
MSTEPHPDSPLRHGILAWTSAYLILTDQSSSGEALYRHYATARSAANGLLAELAVEADVLGFSPATSKKLNLLLSTCLFLGFCDVLSGDIEALASSLSGIRRLLESHWEQFRERLGSLESRILIWLAYLDLRSNFWMSTKPNRPQDSRHFDPLVGGQYYLSECFGPLYPEQELKEDLLQEPAKLLSDDALSIFSKILELETWENDIRCRDTYLQSLVEELRCAKLQAIRADIARVRAECKVIHAELMESSTGENHIVRTKRHCLATTALHLSATILLSRMALPNLRTDDEAQKAARQIVHIARRLQKLGFCSPPSLIWPLPVFIAGIELTDEIY